MIHIPYPSLMTFPEHNGHFTCSFDERRLLINVPFLLISAKCLTEHTLPYWIHFLHCGELFLIRHSSICFHIYEVYMREGKKERETLHACHVYVHTYTCACSMCTQLHSRYTRIDVQRVCGRQWLFTRKGNSE